MKLSIRVKVVLLLVVAAAVPTVVSAAAITARYRDSVELLEAQLQEALLSEASGSVARRVRALRDDAEAVAQALAISAQSPEADSELAAVRAVLATRPAIRGARFEVPSANVSTTIRGPRATQTSAPRSTPELRELADERGVAFELVGSNQGVLVVPVPRISPDGAKGYVTVDAELSVLANDLDQIATRRLQGVTVVLSDHRRTVVASTGTDSLAPGADASRLPVWKRLPDGTPWTNEVGVVGMFEDERGPQVGGVRTISELGWAVGSWRNRDLAYAELTRLRNRTLVIGGLGVVLAVAFGLVFSRAITRPALALAEGARRIGERRWRDVDLPVERGDELGELARSMRDMATNLETSEAELERQTRLRGDLGRFLSRELVEGIVSGKHSLELGGDRREVTVLFADVVAFTPLAESRPAEQVVTLLNELFTMLSEIVFRHEGVVDKFVGDCIMAVWGAPHTQADHADRALAAAEDMLRFLETSALDWRERHGVEVRLGIGVNSGEAIVGNVGSQKRMEYTVIGDVVNVASRLESIARPNQILVGGRTRELAARGFAFRDLGLHSLTGRKEQTPVAELLLDAEPL